MPRVSRAQTDSNRAAIEATSARLFREQGIKNVSVADLMAAVGLTHGGFYGHFASKDALAAVACNHAFAQAHERWEARVASQPDATAALQHLFQRYLRPENRDNPGNGCPLPALAADVAREPADKPVRAAYRDGLGQLLAVLQGLQATGDAATDRSQALAQLSTLVGALLLARATQGDAISDELLAAALAQLSPSCPTPTLPPA